MNWIELKSCDSDATSIVENCTFDIDFCGWTNEKQTDEFDWERGKYTATRLTGPSRDVSGNTINQTFYIQTLTGGLKTKRKEVVGNNNYYHYNSKL